MAQFTARVGMDSLSCMHFVHTEPAQTTNIFVEGKPGGLMPTKRCLSVGYNQSLSLPANPDPFLVTVTVTDPES